MFQKLGSPLVTALAAAMFTGLFLAGCGDKSQQEISQKTSKYRAAESTPKNDSPSPSQTVPQPSTSASGSTIANQGTTPVNQEPAAGGRLANGQQNSTAGQNPPTKPPALASEQLNRYEVPKGDADELVKFANELLDGLEGQLAGKSQEAQIAEATKIFQTAIKALDQALAKKPTDKARRQAIDLKMSVMAQLAMGPFKDAKANDNLREFATSLSKQSDAYASGQGRIMLLWLSLQPLAQQESKDFAGAKAQIEALLKDEKILADPDVEKSVFVLTRQGATVLSQLGQEDDARELFQLISSTFAKSKSPAIASEARELLQQAEIRRLEFAEKQDAALQDAPDAMAGYMSVVDQLLKMDNPGVFLFKQLSESANLLEVTKHYKESVQVLEKLHAVYEKSDNKELAARVADAVEKGKKRAGLVGQPFQVNGVLSNGQPFDWKNYKDKVVLIDFWATWCGPCLREIPNIRANYDLYKSKGFEVVSINLDDEPNRMKQFLQLRPLPWVTVVDPQANGFDNSMALKCGVDSIPFLVLVGKDGKVTDLHTRGEELGKKLAELLGPPETANPVETTPGKKSSSLQGPHRGPQFQFVALPDEEQDKKSEQKKPSSFLDATSNPYLAPAAWSASQLVEFLFDMEDKPKSIQARPGFLEATVDAADRVMADAKASDKQKQLAALSKFQALHKRASFGNEKADQQLIAFVEAMKDDKREQIAKEVKFLQLERKVIDVDKMPNERVADLLDELEEFFAANKLSRRHLRIASSTVHAINLLDDGKKREEYFSKFGKTFAKSQDRELARYGKKLSKAPSNSALVGQPMELDGTTAAGQPFDWASYRGKIVIVDFWATWCGPCRRQMPHVVALHEKLKDQGFEVVGVSLDKDLEALARYIDENAIPWSNLAGDGTQDLANRYGVRGIPTMMLIDADGKIVDVAHNVAKLAAKAEKLVAALQK